MEKNLKQLFIDNLTHIVREFEEAAGVNINNIHFIRVDMGDVTKLSQISVISGIEIVMD